jgi:hypothetical protein
MFQTELRHLQAHLQNIGEDELSYNVMKGTEYFVSL